MHAAGVQPKEGRPSHELSAPLHQHFNAHPPEEWAQVPHDLGESFLRAGTGLGELVDSTLKERTEVATELRR